MATMLLPNMTRNAKRFETIVRTLARYGLADWVRDWNSDFVKDYFKDVDGQSIAERPREERLRLAFAELGTHPGVAPPPRDQEGRRAAEMKRCGLLRRYAARAPRPAPRDG